MPVSEILNPLRVLIVDDDEADVFLTKEALKTSSFEVCLDSVGDGVDALEYLRDDSNPLPDLIFLDLNMPRKNGLQTLQEIKLDESLCSIPVIVLTTSDSCEDIARCYGTQASCYVTKPLELDEFASMVTTVSDFWFGVVRYPR